jgi:hypothetical protein
MEKVVFDEETEKDFQGYIKQFENTSEHKDDEWYNDHRIIWWNINNS